MCIGSRGKWRGTEAGHLLDGVHDLKEICMRRATTLLPVAVLENTTHTSELGEEKKLDQELNSQGGRF